MLLDDHLGEQTQGIRRLRQVEHVQMVADPVSSSKWPIYGRVINATSMNVTMKRP
jgi:hypothetical protein